MTESNQVVRMDGHYFGHDGETWSWIRAIPPTVDSSRSNQGPGRHRPELPRQTRPMRLDGVEVQPGGTYILRHGEPLDVRYFNPAPGQQFPVPRNLVVEGDLDLRPIAGIAEIGGIDGTTGAFHNLNRITNVGAPELPEDAANRFLATDAAGEIGWRTTEEWNATNVQDALDELRVGGGLETRDGAIGLAPEFTARVDAMQTEITELRQEVARLTALLTSPGPIMPLRTTNTAAEQAALAEHLERQARENPPEIRVQMDQAEIRGAERRLRMAYSPIVAPAAPIITE
jgi:hypothetical protein